MNKKLKRVLEEIQKTENRIARWQEHLDELLVYKEQIEDQEIIKSVRAMKLDSWSLMKVLDKINSGDIPFQCDSSGEEKEEMEKAAMPEGDLDASEKIEEIDVLSGGITGEEY